MNKRKIKDEFLGDFILNYEEYSNEDYTSFKLLRKNIREKYDCLLEEKLIDDINIEISRVKNCKNVIESNINNYNLSVYSIVIALIIGFLSIVGNFVNQDDNMKNVVMLITIFAILFYILLTYRILKEIVIKHKKSVIYDLALQVLEDIEKELKQNKAKNNSACEEVAAATTDDDIDVKINTIAEDIKSIKRYIGIK